jgi:hypothetical protein
MGGLVRLVLFGFIILTVIYVVLSYSARRGERRRLEQEWELEGLGGDKETHVREGLAAYDGSLRRKLILGVYVVPLVVVGTIIYVVNYM